MLPSGLVGGSFTAICSARRLAVCELMMGSHRSAVCDGCRGMPEKHVMSITTMCFVAGDQTSERNVSGSCTARLSGSHAPSRSRAHDLRCECSELLPLMAAAMQQRAGDQVAGVATVDLVSVCKTDRLSIVRKACSCVSCAQLRKQIANANNSRLAALGVADPVYGCFADCDGRGYALQAVRIAVEMVAAFEVLLLDSLLCCAQRSAREL
jgi:hypothetical protein